VIRSPASRQTLIIANVVLLASAGPKFISGKTGILPSHDQVSYCFCVPAPLSAPPVQGSLAGTATRGSGFNVPIEVANHHSAPEGVGPGLWALMSAPEQQERGKLPPGQVKKQLAELWGHHDINNAVSSSGGGGSMGSMGSGRLAGGSGGRASASVPKNNHVASATAHSARTGGSGGHHSGSDPGAGAGGGSAVAPISSAAPSAAVATTPPLFSEHELPVGSVTAGGNSTAAMSSGSSSNASASGHARLGGGSARMSVTPEPGTLLLMATGLATALGAARRRSKRTA